MISQDRQWNQWFKRHTIGGDYRLVRANGRGGIIIIALLRRGGRVVSSLGKAVRISFVYCRHDPLARDLQEQGHTGCCELWPWTLTKRGAWQNACENGTFVESRKTQRRKSARS
jgi:hypothetical protein